ncbi:MAG: hypothetical protein Ct9H300mP16_02700 [Pseudomonadota bacterium]|nr:MAG: hypothetical protein Ct9H300mP16_02700 [Pseudomonadota bacterium]
MSSVRTRAIATLKVPGSGTGKPSCGTGRAPHGGTSTDPADQQVGDDHQGNEGPNPKSTTRREELLRAWSWAWKKFIGYQKLTLGASWIAAESSNSSSAAS